MQTKLQSSSFGGISNDCPTSLQMVRIVGVIKGHIFASFVRSSIIFFGAKVDGEADVRSASRGNEHFESSCVECNDELHVVLEQPEVGELQVSTDLYELHSVQI